MALTPPPPPIASRLAADLATHDSATEVLGRWCARRRWANPPIVLAMREAGAAKPATPEIRRRLDAAPGEKVAYRRVKLTCGGRLLSEADNWYLPDRLTRKMNQELDHGDVPFGVVARPLRFHRKPVGAPIVGRAAVPYVLRQRALLVGAGGRPISFVQENYTVKLVGR
ncbi:MAG: hypothetical protein ACR2F8_14345 [Caulobacteraceae bacterium]